MKTLIVISAILVLTTTNFFAQDNALEIKNLEKGVITGSENQFKLFSHEELEVNLKFTLKKLDSYKVVILNDHNQIVYSKKIKEGVNKVSFNTEQEEEYTVKLISDEKTNLLALQNKN